MHQKSSGLSAPPDPLAALGGGMGPPRRGGRGKGREGKGRGGKEREGEGREGEGREGEGREGRGKEGKGRGRLGPPNPKMKLRP